MRCGFPAVAGIGRRSASKRPALRERWPGPLESVTPVRYLVRRWRGSSRRKAARWAPCLPCWRSRPSPSPRGVLWSTCRCPARWSGPSLRSGGTPVIGASTSVPPSALRWVRPRPAGSPSPVPSPAADRSPSTMETGCGPPTRISAGRRPDAGCGSVGVRWSASAASTTAWLPSTGRRASSVDTWTHSPWPGVADLRPAVWPFSRGRW